MDEVDFTKMPHDQAILKIMEIFGFDQIEAEFHLKLELGLIDGDIVEEDAPTTE